MIKSTQQEIIARAIVRAKKALKDNIDAEISYGFCSGVITPEKTSFISCWCAMIVPNDQIFIGGGLNVLLPPMLKNKLDRGTLLEEEIDLFLEDNFNNPYSRIVEYATLAYKQFLDSD